MNAVAMCLQMTCVQLKINNKNCCWTRDCTDRQGNDYLERTTRENILNQALAIVAGDTTWPFYFFPMVDFNRLTNE